MTPALIPWFQKKTEDTVFIKSICNSNASEYISDLHEISKKKLQKFDKKIQKR
jgi:hypothetical protein